MKTIKNYGSTFLLAVLMLGVVSTMNAQGRGNGRDNNPGRGHGKENPGRGHEKRESPARGRDKKFEHRDNDRDRDHHVRDNRDSRDSRFSHNWDYRNRRHVTYTYHRYRRPMWAPVYGYHYNTRYIYYNDYNVYYDCHRDVFLTWTGRRWVVTHVVPDFMIHLNFNNAVVSGVDYWNDDFDFYLAKRRPTYVSIRAGW
jgi:hypothetical protein